MVQALIHLDDNTNRVLNIVKAEQNLTDKSEAVAFVVNKYIENSEQPQLRPEFIKKIQRIERQKSIKVKDFSARYEL